MDEDAKTLLREIAHNTAVTSELMRELVEMARTEAFRGSSETERDRVDDRVSPMPLDTGDTGPIVIEGDTPTQFELTKAWEVARGSLMVVGRQWEKVSSVQVYEGMTDVRIETYAGTVRHCSREELVPLVSELGEA